MYELSHFLGQMQQVLFPRLEEEFGGLTKKERHLVEILEVTQIHRVIQNPEGGSRGRPTADRVAIARAFVAKAVLGIPTTRQLIEQLITAPSLRRICGWSRAGEVPSESTFSRAFAEFARSGVLEEVHRRLITYPYEDRIVGNVSVDSTIIAAPERVPKRRKPKEKKRKTSDKLKRQLHAQDLETMMDGIPTEPRWGAKRNSRGNITFESGYKLHVGWTDCGIPLVPILTSASVHDSQVAIPLMWASTEKFKSLYDVMDSAYDAREIREFSRKMGHVPIIDPNTRGHRNRRESLAPHERIHLKVRTTAERGFAWLKTSFGARYLRVRGPLKAMTHLMFGIIALTAERIIRLLS